MSNFLIVVDMQPGFLAASCKKLQNNCRKAIVQSIKNKEYIIYLEFKDEGPTLSNLTSLTDRYRRKFVLTKNEWDGSPEVLSLIKKHKLPGDKFKVCGVYTNCCVEATVRGLLYDMRNNKVSVLSKSCGASNTRDHKDGLNEMAKIGAKILKS